MGILGLWGDGYMLASADSIVASAETVFLRFFPWDNPTAIFAGRSATLLRKIPAD